MERLMTDEPPQIAATNRNQPQVTTAVTLANRLREQFKPGGDIYAAADELERLSAENEKMRKIIREWTSGFSEPSADLWSADGSRPKALGP